jgi:hypothetical protein
MHAVGMLIRPYFLGGGGDCSNCGLKAFSLCSSSAYFTLISLQLADNSYKISVFQKLLSNRFCVGSRAGTVHVLLQDDYCFTKEFGLAALHA